MKTIIQTDQAPAAIGPYSQAVQSGSLLFISGQIPIDPATGELVSGGFRPQTLQVLAHLKAVLAAAEATFEHVVKTTVFLADMADFPEFNALYADAFGDMEPPARSTLQVAALPKGALIEIEALAAI